jgi:hypothetical protein
MFVSQNTMNIKDERGEKQGIGREGNQRIKKST